MTNHGLTGGEFYNFSLEYVSSGSAAGLHTIKLCYQSARQALAGNMDNLEITDRSGLDWALASE